MSELCAASTVELRRKLLSTFKMPETVYERGWSYERFKRANLRGLVPQRRYFKHRKKRMRKKLVKRFLRLQYLAILNGEYIRDVMKRDSFARRILPPRSVAKSHS